MTRYPLDPIFNNRLPNFFTSMSTAIDIDEGVKKRLQLLDRVGESYDEILNRLMDSLEDMDVEEIIEARWLKLPREMGKYIPLKRLT